MRFKKKFLDFMADIAIKIFQIVFAMLVIGMFLREQFNFITFILGLIISIVLLTGTIAISYNSAIKGED